LALAAIVAIFIGPVIGTSTPRAVAATDGGSLVGEGGSAFYPVIEALLIADQSSLAPLNPTYTNVKLDNSIADFVGSAPGQFDTDYALSERPLSTAEANLAKTNGRSFAYVPFAATPVAIVTLVPNNAWAQKGTQTITPSDFCRGMPLTVTLLGELFGYDASSPFDHWGDDVSNGQPLGCAGGGGNGGGVVTLWANADPTVENEALMALLDSDPTSKGYFDAGLQRASTHGFGLTTSDTPSESWPYAGQTVIGGDQSLIGKLLNVNATTNAPDNVAADWQLGTAAPISSVWTGTPLGAVWDLATAAIQNAQGSFVAPSTPAAQASETDATLAVTSDPATNGIVTFSPSTTDAAAYNSYLMMEEYLVVPTNTLAADKATKLAQFIRFVLGTAGQKVIESFGAAPATPAMVTSGLKVAAQLSALGLSGAGTTTTTAATTASTTTNTSSNATVASAGLASDSATNGAGDSSSGGQGGSVLASTGSNLLPLVGVGTMLVLISVISRRRLLRRAVTAVNEGSMASGHPIARSTEGER